MSDLRSELLEDPFESKTDSKSPLVEEAKPNLIELFFQQLWERIVGWMSQPAFSLPPLQRNGSIKPVKEPSMSLSNIEFDGDISIPVTDRNGERHVFANGKQVDGHDRIFSTLSDDVEHTVN